MQSKPSRSYVAYQPVSTSAVSSSSVSGNQMNHHRHQFTLNHNNNSSGVGVKAYGVTYEPETSMDMEEDDPDDPAVREYSIAVLGSGKVGKSSLIRQFVHLEHDESYEPTPSCKKYHKAVYVDGRIFDLTIRDCPGVTCFPADTVAEWTDYKGYGLHLSQVYVLVYDINSKDTFNYVKSMRDQIQEIKGSDSLIIIVGNKMDLAEPPPTTSNYKANFVHGLSKKWKCPFVLCSARMNWHVIEVFKEVLKAIESEIDSKKETGNRSNGRWLSDCKVS